jgi:predicted metal-dependent phosphoesterase TrpH
MIDLHLHTHHSDGTWSPRELVEHAAKIGMKHIAITDHDTVAGVAEAIDAAGARLEVIPAVEINTVYDDAQGLGHDVHILGYFIDTANTELEAVLARQKAARAEHVLDCIELVSSSGIKITLADVQACAGKGAVGKAHLTEAIVRAGGAEDLTAAYQKYMVRTSPYFAQRKSVAPLEAVQAIKAAGGIPSIAHPGKEAHVIPLIESLAEQGLMGIEAFHRVHNLSLLRKYLRYAGRHKMLVTGGSDCHGPYQQFQSMMGTISVPPEVLTTLKKARFQL